MKNFRSKHASIATARWAAYTAAGVATALAGNQPVEASIHYSGRPDVSFPPHENMAQKFQLDQAWDSVLFERRGTLTSGNYAGLVMYGILSAECRR